jgi:hypothetical protein
VQAKITPLGGNQGRAKAQTVSRRLPTAESQVEAQVRSGEICGGQVALGQVFSEYFGFPFHSFHQLVHTHHQPSGAGTIGQTMADVPSGLSLTPPRNYEAIKQELRKFGFEQDWVL